MNGNIATPEDLANTFKKFSTHPATYEYPGYVRLSLASGRVWEIGTANAEWQADLVDQNGHMLDDCRYVAPANSDLTRVLAGVVRLLVELA